MTIFDDFHTKTADLYAGVIKLLCDAGLGDWDETGILPEDDIPAIFLGKPGPIPTRALALNIYTLNTDIERGVDKMGLSILIRTPEEIPLEAIQIADKLEDFLHGREHIYLLESSKWHIPIIWRHSLADLGPNENGHYQLTDTYHFYVDVPERQ